MWQSKNHILCLSPSPSLSLSLSLSLSFPLSQHAPFVAGQTNHSKMWNQCEMPDITQNYLCLMFCRKLCNCASLTPVPHKSWILGKDTLQTTANKQRHAGKINLLPILMAYCSLMGRYIFSVCECTVLSNSWIYSQRSSCIWRLCAENSRWIRNNLQGDVHLRVLIANCHLRTNITRLQGSC